MSKFVNQLCNKLEDKLKSVTWKGSLNDYIKLVEHEPYKHTRTAFQLLNDMIHYYGSYKIHNCGQDLTRYKLFDDPFDNGKHAVYGLDRTLMQIVANLRTIASRGGNERIIILHGPVATAKTSIARLLIKGLEEYSMTEEGSMYTFNWVFSDKVNVKNIGFRLNDKNDDEESFANLDEEDLVAAVPCQLNDNPLLLIPKKERRAFLDNLANKHNFLVPKKILEGELCYNCQSIFNHLLKKYNGNLKKVYRHVQVERVVVSEIDKLGAATVQPVQNTDGQAPTLVWETSRYENVAKLLKNIRIHQFEGKWAAANRGIIHLTDMFKKNGIYLQYLLSAVEEHLIDFNGVQGYIDVAIIGTTNPEDYSMFERHPGSKALIDRSRKVDIGYVLQASEEAKIYKRQLVEAGYKEVKEHENDVHLYPHVLDILSLWAVMTRLKKPNYRYYHEHGLEDEKIEALEELDPLVKAKLYDGEIFEELEFDTKTALKDKYFQKLLRNEHKDENVDGVSPRVVQNLITDIISRKESEENELGRNKGRLSMFRVFNALENLVQNSDLDFLKTKAEGDYKNFELHLKMLQSEYNRLVTKEVKDAILNLPKHKIKEKVNEYVRNVSAYVRNVKVKNKVTGREEPPNEDKMRWLEEKVGVSEVDKDSFREEVIMNIGRASSPNNNTDFDVYEICKDLFVSLEDGLFKEKVKNLRLSNDKMVTAFERFGTEKFQNLEPSEQETVKTTLDNMVNHYNYCYNCAKDIVLYTLKENLVKLEVEKDD